MDRDALASLAHPEELNAKVTITLGEKGSMVATARATPAGLISAGILVATILLSVAALVRAGKSRPS